MKKDFLSITDMTKQELLTALDHGIALKKQRNAYTPLKGKTFLLLFEKPSLRTRLSFEVGIKELGGHAIYMHGSEIGLGVRESICDVSNVVSRMCDGIIARVKSHETLEKLSFYSSVPVINALSDKEHPCQTLADLMTIFEYKETFKNITIAYLGDGNNVLSSLILASSMLGISVNVSSPSGYCLSEDIIKNADSCLNLCNNPQDAVKGADIVVTDTWVSMGDEAERAVRLNVFQPFQVNSKLMSLAKKDAIFMHCMPAHRGEEVTSEVIDGPQSVILDEAENRLHVQKALLISLMENPSHQRNLLNSNT